MSTGTPEGPQRPFFTISGTEGTFVENHVHFGGTGRLDGGLMERVEAEIQACVPKVREERAGNDPKALVPTLGTDGFSVQDGGEMSEAGC